MNCKSEQDELLFCPHCNSREGYYRNVRYHGWGIYRFAFSESTPQPDNTDMYDGVPYTDSPKAYCLTCDKEIKELRAST